MIFCEKCGSDKFHFSEELGIVCEDCVRRPIPTYLEIIENGSSKMDLITSDEIYE